MDAAAALMMNTIVAPQPITAPAISVPVAIPRLQQKCVRLISCPFSSSCEQSFTSPGMMVDNDQATEAFVIPKT